MMIGLTQGLCIYYAQFWRPLLARSGSRTFCQAGQLDQRVIGEEERVGPAGEAASILIHAAACGSYTRTPGVTPSTEPGPTTLARRVTACAVPTDHNQAAPVPSVHQLLPPPPFSQLLLDSRAWCAARIIAAALWTSAPQSNLAMRRPKAAACNAVLKVRASQNPNTLQVHQHNRHPHNVFRCAHSLLWHTLASKILQALDACIIASLTPSAI